MDEDDAIFTPSDFVKYLTRERKISPDEVRVPCRLLITYQRRVYDYAKRLVDGEPIDWWIYDDYRPLCKGKYNGKEIGVDNIWVGAPAAAMTLEELIACGAGVIFEVGLCGGLQDFLKPGDIIVVTEAIRDEGTSHHYFPSKVKVKSSERLKNTFVNNLNEKRIQHHIGHVWSTDGVYRETRKKFGKFKKAGVLGVDMETSAIFAVAKYRGVEAGSAQVISDILTETEWQQHFFRHQRVRKNTKILVKAALETLSQS